MVLHYLVKCECQKTGSNLKYVLWLMITIFKIREHLKLQAKWLTVSYAPLALYFCPERCRTHQISKITWTETVTNCCYVNMQINVSLLSTNIKLL